MLAICLLTDKNWGMQGSSDLSRGLLDAEALCRHLVAKGSVEDFLADHRGELFSDGMFADLCPTRCGRPSVPADVVATVMVLQALDGLSDRDAAARLRTNIAWKAATGLSLADPGFHPTVLTLWRNKLRASEAPQRIFDAVRQVVAESGAVAGKHRRALDSTALDDAVVRQDALMQLVAQIRRVRRLVPEAKALELSTHDYDNDPGKPACAWDDQEAIDAVVSSLAGDALTTLAALDGLSLEEIQSEAVGLLALVAGQDVEPGGEEGTWCMAPVTRPDRMVSVIDPESRHVHKTNHNYRDGFQAHIAVEPDSGLITACDLTRAMWVMPRRPWVCSRENPEAPRSWPTRPMDLPIFAGPSKRPGTRRSSRLCRCTMRSKAASAPATSSSTPWRGRPLAPTESPPRSPRATPPSSVASATGAPSASAAPRPRGAVR